MFKTITKGLDFHQRTQPDLSCSTRGTPTTESKWLLNHRDDEIIWTGRRLVGAGSGDVWLQSALLLSGVIDKPLLVGWMCGRVADEELIDVEEFFIWPTYRRRGLATALAGRTLLYAWADKVRRVRWVELEADCIVNARVGSHLPRWARGFNWQPPDESVGWGVSRVTEEMPLMPLLSRLGELHVPGGVQLVWRDGIVSVVDHPTEPAYGLAVEREVPRPNSGQTATFD